MPEVGIVIFFAFYLDNNCNNCNFVVNTKIMKKDYNRTDFLKMLANAGIRSSVQRLAILEYVFMCESHPAAEEIYSALVRSNPMLSRTTVFNNLRLLSEKGILNDMDISSESTRYDSTDTPPHAHFMCRKCRRIFDIPLAMPVMSAPHGFHCDNVNVFFKGVCPQCMEKSDVDKKK